MYTPSQRVQVLQSETESLKAYLSELPDEAWSIPSACDRWTVADVVAHIAGALESYTANVRRGLQGDSSPPPGRPSPGTWSTASAEERTRRAEEAAQRIVSYRQELGDRLLSTLHQSIDGFKQLLDSLTPVDWDRLCYHGRGEIPIPNQVTYAVLEVCLHRRDIQSKLEPDAHVSVDGVKYLIEHLPEYVHWAFVMDTDLAESKRYRFQLSGAVSQELDVIFDDQQARLVDTDSPAIGAVFRCDAENFLLMMCGRIKFSDAINQGLLLPSSGSGTPSVFTRWSQAI